MIKRINRITALVVAATSIAAVTPATAKTIQLVEQAGDISKAVAYKDGKYIYEGYKNEVEKGVYYNDGTSSTSEKALEDIENLDDITKINSSYIIPNTKENEQINLEDGSINDEFNSIEDGENLIKRKLQGKLGKSDRYGSYVNVKEVDSVTKDGFKNNIWYSYQAEVNEAYNENEFLVKDNNIYDENRFADQTRVEIAITALWNSKFTIDGKEFAAGASTRSGAKFTLKQILSTEFAHYKVGQAAVVATDSTGKYYKIMMTLLPKEGYEIPAELPEDIISMYDDKKKTLNTISGLQQYEMSATLIKIGGEIFQDTWSSEFDNKSRIEIDVTALWNSKFRIDGKEFDAGSSSLGGAKKVKQELLSAQFDNYTVGQVAMLSSDGKFYHVKMTLLPKGGVEIQQELPNGFIAMLDKETWKTTLEAWEMSAKATVIGGEIVQDIWSNEFDSKSRIEVDVTGLWNSKFRIDGKEFDAGSNNLEGAKKVKKELLDAQFDNYTVGQVVMLTSDGQYYHVKMTLLPKEGVEVQKELPNGFIAMLDKETWKTTLEAWEMTAKATVIGGEIVQDIWSNEFDSKSRIEVEVSALWNNFKIAGKEFAATGNSLDGAKDAKKKLLETQFDNYTVGQVAMLTDDGQYYRVKMTLLPKDGVKIEPQVAEEFISMLDGGNWKTKSSLSWEMNANATVVGGSVDEKQYKTIITLKVKAFYSKIGIAGYEYTPQHYNKEDAPLLVEGLKSGSFSDGYELISATVDEANVDNEVTIKLGNQTEITEVPLDIAKFGGTDLSKDQWGNFYGPGWSIYDVKLENPDIVDKISLLTMNLQEENATTSAAVQVDVSETDNLEGNANVAQAEVQSLKMTLGDVYAAVDQEATEQNKAIYYGYTDEDGNYLDCSYTANLTVFTGEQVIKFDKFNSTNTKDGSEFKLGLPKLIATLGQDKEYIYSLISVPVYGAKTEYGLVTIDEPSYYIQKISKEASGTKIDGAYIPESVETYQLSDSMVSGANGWDKDNWSYRNAKEYIVNQYLNDANSKITVSNGAMYFIHMKTEDDGDKRLESSKIIFKDSGKVILSDKTEVKEKIAMVEFGNESKEEPKDWTVDKEGNAWCIYNGRIQRSNQGKQFEDVYRVDSAIDRLDVYDENNLIGWSTDDEIYVTNKEGEVGTTLVTKTGWRKEADGKWHVYDTQGNQTKGWVKFGSCWYYFDENGAMKNGWLELKGKSYYLSNSGVMQIGWCEVDETWYYFNQSGEKQSNVTVDGYSLDENGALKK